MTALDFYTAKTIDELAVVQRALRTVDAMELPMPLVHPVLYEALGNAARMTVDALKAIGNGSANDDDLEGVEGLMTLARRHLTGHHVDELFTHRLPRPPASPPLPDSPLGIHPIELELRTVQSALERMQALQRVKAPLTLVSAGWAVMQGGFENLVARVCGHEPPFPQWIETNPRELARILRLDEGKDLDDEALWTWASTATRRSAVSELGAFRENPWARADAVALAPILLDAHTLVVTRYGILSRANDGQWLPLVLCGPLRPIATDGRHVAFLGPNPRGDYRPCALMFDAQLNDFIDSWPETMPQRFVSGHWAERSLLIRDRAQRRERLLRRSYDEDYGHHVSSPDGRLVWLVEWPGDGILRVDDGSVHVDLSRFGVEFSAEVFPRAFTQLPSGPLRLFAHGQFFQDLTRVWSTDEAVDGAAFDLAGQRLATVAGQTLRLRSLGPGGEVVAETTEQLPLPSFPKSLAHPEFEDVLLAMYGSLEQARLDDDATILESMREGLRVWFADDEGLTEWISALR